MCSSCCNRRHRAHDLPATNITNTPDVGEFYLGGPRSADFLRSVRVFWWYSQVGAVFGSGATALRGVSTPSSLEQLLQALVLVDAFGAVDEEVAALADRRGERAGALAAAASCPIDARSPCSS